MLLLIQRLTQRPKKPSETEKEVVGIKLQSPQSPSATQQGGSQPKRIGNTRRADTRPQDAANKTKRKAKVKWQATSNKVE